MDKKDNIILAFESSCDETSVAVVKNGSEILSNIVATQVASHQRFGGVVPEVASRHHIEQITYCIQDALDEANIDYEDLDPIAVTSRAALAGPLLAGVAAPKAIAFAHNLRFIPVYPLAGPLYAATSSRPIHCPTLPI